MKFSISHGWIDPARWSSLMPSNKWCRALKTFFIWLFGLVACGFVGALIGHYSGDREVLGFVIGLVAFAFFKLLVVPERTDRYGTGGFDE